MRPRIRVAAIIQHQDRLLCVQHSKGRKKYWLLPGGGIEFTERADEALIRELKEETNLDIEVQNLAFITESISFNKRTHIVHVVFFATVLGGTLALPNEKRISGVKYLTLKELAKETLHPPILNEIKSLIENPESAPRYFHSEWLPG